MTGREFAAVLESGNPMIIRVRFTRGVLRIKVREADGGTSTYEVEASLGKWTGCLLDHSPKLKFRLEQE